MNQSDNTIMKIAPDTYIPDLVKAGVVPLWMWEDIEPHGMSEAENILCEWDWEYGWDIGDGYDSFQISELARVRKIISDGIWAFEADPRVIQDRKEKREIAERKEKLFKKYRTLLYGYFEHDDIRKIINFEIKFGRPPYISLLTKYLFSDKRTDRQKIRLLQAGVLTGTKYTPKQVFEMNQSGEYPIDLYISEKFNLRRIQRWKSKSFNTSGQLGEYISAIAKMHPEPFDQTDLENVISKMIEEERAELGWPFPQLSSLVNAFTYLHHQEPRSK